MEGILTVIQGLSVLALLCNLAGNAIVIAVVRKVESMKTKTNYMLLSLAGNDIQFGVMFFKEIFRYYVYRDAATLGESSAALLFHIFVSLFTLAAIAVERYYAVLKPFVHRARMSKKLVKMVAICIWIAGLIVTMPEIAFVALFGSESPSRNIYVLSVLIVCITVPGLVMTSCYSKIVYRIWFKTNELETTYAGVLKSRKRLTKLLVTVTLVFFICWTPLLGRPFVTQQKSFYTMFSGLIALIGTAINPVLYSLRSVRFRQAVRELFSRVRCRKTRSVREIQRPGTQLQTTPL